jgi:CBS domain containing-hemolysin-like protein
MTDDPSSRNGWPQSSDGQQPDPSTGLIDSFRDWLRGLGLGRNGEANLRESLEELIEEHQQAVAPIDPEERLMLLNILNFGELRVRDVMVPRADIVALDVSSGLSDALDLFRTANHSRIPVFRETLDDVLGMVHIKDLIRFWGEEIPFDLSTVTRKVVFVPPSMPVLALLMQMRASRVHMALVVDEYGGIDGLVTIEDLVEEIVGEIQDEHDVIEGPLLVENADGSFDADARAEVEELEQLVGVDLLPEDWEEEVDTLGGLVFSLLGRVPRRGEVVGHPVGLEFEVIDADPRRIKRLRVRRQPKAEGAPEAAGEPGAL